MSTARRRTAILAIVGAVAVLVGLVTYATDLFERLELDSVDARFSVRGTEPPPDDLVVIEIDDTTLNELKERWPIPRSLHGELVERLTDAGAKVIAYDVEFTAPTELREDRALILAVDAAGPTVMSTTKVNAEGESNVFGGEEVMRDVGARAGNTQLPPSPGGVLRRLPFETRGLESFAVSVAEERDGVQVDAGEFEEDGAWIDYHGPPGTFPSFSFVDVLDGEVPAEEFGGKVVVIGVSVPTVQDLHPTPTSGDELMVGAEVQANAISTVIRGLPLQSAPGVVNVALIALMGLLAPALSLRTAPLVAFGVSLAAAALFLVAAQVAFNAGWVLAVVYPLLALLVGAVGALTVHYLIAAFERQRIHLTFSRFVPEQVVDQVLAKTDEDLRLAGEEREATVLFSDLRGFTTVAESLPARQVIEILNRYLEEMSDAIMDEGGTLVAYMGDGIMAVFGAPLEQPDHADRALRAAREMVGPRLERFNAWITEAGLGEGFRMGVGLNSGQVMSGQVGSERRVEYTAVGDTTNTAARLEGMTKGTEHQLFVAESTRSLMRDAPEDLVFVDELEVRGRGERIRVWGLGQ